MEMQKQYYLKTDKKAFFYPKDMKNLLELLTDRQKYVIKFLLNTGARINEARHVDKQDLDKERRNITLRITKVRAKRKEERPDPRIIPVSTRFFKYLYLNINKHPFLSTNQVRMVLKDKAHKLELKNWKDYSAHNLRKTFGTWLLALGVDGFKLAQHLGHDPNTLRINYASPDIFNSDDKKIMLDLLDDLPLRLRSTAFI